MIKEMRKKDREISSERAYEIIKNSEYGFLATVSEDGSPYCIAVSHVLVGNDIYFHCAKSGHKIDNILNDSRVCFAAVGKTNVIPEGFTTEYESAVAFGTAEFIEGRDEKISALLKICEKYSPEYMKEAAESAERAAHITQICRITVEHITGKAKAGK